MTEITITVSEPTQPEAEELTMDDVWGIIDEDKWERINNGMLVARGAPNDYVNTFDNIPQTCPIWNDRLPYKSVTVVCQIEQIDEVEYWLEYVHGGGSISQYKELPNGKIAIRSNYMCW